MVISAAAVAAWTLRELAAASVIAGAGPPTQRRLGRGVGGGAAVISMCGGFMRLRGPPVLFSAVLGCQQLQLVASGCQLVAARRC